MQTLQVWWMAFRPKTLTAAIVPVVVGTALFVVSTAPVQWWITLCALAGALFIQIGTNLVNDALDFKKGADTSERQGPRRVTQQGLMSFRSVMRLALFSFAAAVACGVPLVLHGGWVIVAIGVVSIACGYAYTGGPFPLAYRGLGDVFVILFFGLVAVGGVYFLHAGGYRWEAFVAGLQVGMLATVLIAINNLRDVEGDRQVGKKTLAVRFGVSFARLEIALLLLAPFALNLFWAAQGFVWAAVLPWLSLPLALKVVRGVYRQGPGPVYNRFLGQSAGVHLIFGLCLAGGFVLQRAL